MSPVCFVTEVLSTLRSFAPPACKPLPNLPRFACADLRYAPPSALLRVGIPLGLHLLPPPFPTGRSACTCRVSTRTCNSNRNHEGEASDEEAKPQQQTEYLPDRYRPHSLQP